MGALPGHSRGHQIQVWLGEGNESGLGKISVTSLVIWFEGKSGGTQEPSNCNQAGDIIWSHRVCSNFILHSPIPSQLRGVCVCVCVCVRWLIYCKPHGCLLGVGLRLGDCYIFWPHSPAFWESEASDKVCDTIGQQNNWMSRADVVASGPRHHSRVARQEHRWRVFLIFFLEIPFPWGLQAQEALVIS